MAKSQRKAISTGTRFRIFDRDSFTCAYCGRTPPAVVLHVDHVRSIAEGGSNDESNLITSCADCNLGKGRKALGSHAPVDYASRTDELKERADQMEAYQAHLARYRGQIDRMVDLVGVAFWGPGKTWCPERDGKKRSQVTRFINLLGLEAVCEAAEIAANKFGDAAASDQWRYFCGICWRKAPSKGAESNTSEQFEYEDMQSQVVEELESDGLMDMPKEQYGLVGALLYAVLESRAHPDGSLRHIRMQYTARQIEELVLQFPNGDWVLDCIRMHTGGW